MHSVALAILVACASEPPATESITASDPEEVVAIAESSAVAEQPGPSGPRVDLPPNELGEIMVLEYHRLGEPENEFRRTPENFRADLQRLHDAGYRPITVRQLVDGDIDVPAGTTPVVFTIDDSSAGQFYLLEDGRIDPNSMVGIWDEFRAEHQEWRNGATWCVLPAADHPSNFFGERPSREVPRQEREERIRRKVEHLVGTGHEICNHTLYHARLDRARDDAQVQEWIGRAEDSLRVYLPEGYDMATLSLPLGMWPKNRELAYRGVFRGRPYEYRAVLEVAGGQERSPSPFDRDFDPRSINRLIVAPGMLERQMAKYERRPELRYVSDGDPAVVTIPRDAEGRFDRARWERLELRFTD